MSMRSKFHWIATLLVVTAIGCAEKTPNSVVPPVKAPDEATQTNKVETADEVDGGSRIAQGEKGMVVSVHPLATKAGVEVLKRGGNAVDAAIAAGLTLGVVDSHNSGIG